MDTTELDTSLKRILHAFALRAAQPEATLGDLQGWITLAIGEITDCFEGVKTPSKSEDMRQFDLNEYERMREVLEDHGYSPDAAGIRALIAQHKAAKPEIDDIETRLVNYDPTLRERWTVAASVGILITRLRRKDEHLKAVVALAEEGLK